LPRRRIEAFQTPTLFILSGGKVGESGDSLPTMGSLATDINQVPSTDERRKSMPLLQLVIVLVVVGVVLWVINSYIPMQSTMKKILNVVVIVVVVVWLLSVFGVIGNLSNIRIGR
jgi:hypothetical protein